MRTIILIASFFSAINFVSYAQNVVTIQPGLQDGKDCEVFSLQPDSNFEIDLIRPMTWTFQGEIGVLRGLLQFDLSSVPAGSVINSAFLSLYSPNPPATQFHSGENTAYVSRITGGWEESTVTWNIQPTITSVHRVTLPESTAEYQDYLDIDVTLLVRDMVDFPLNSFGFMLHLEDESPLHRMSFCSSEYPDETKHPKLVIHFTPPTCKTLVLQPGAAGKDSEVFSLQPNSNFTGSTFRGMSWTFQGDPGDVRGLIDFDLSVLPADAEIELAYLSLFSPDPPTSEFHSGANTSVIRRITSTWQENLVTWNNQPTSTSVHQVLLDSPSNDYQDFVNIDVTTLVQDMRADPNHSFGFLLRLVNEDPLSRLAFVTGEYLNPKKHPRLEVCYNSSVAVPEPDAQSVIRFFPNPCFNQVSFDLDFQVDRLNVQIADVFGRILLEQIVDPQLPIDMSSFSPSVYIVRIMDLHGAQISSQKLIKL